jgi:Flp pilus assembly pilin Flp
MIREFFSDEDGMGVVEVILIIVVLVTIAAIFKKQIVALVNNIWTSINKDAKNIYG